MTAAQRAATGGVLTPRNGYAVPIHTVRIIGPGSSKALPVPLSAATLLNKVRISWRQDHWRTDRPPGSASAPMEKARIRPLAAACRAARY